MHLASLLPIALLAASFVACSGHHQRPAPCPLASSFRVALPKTRVQILAERLAAVERARRESASCDSSCCLGPEHWPWKPNEPTPDQEQRRLLREILDSSAPSEVRGLAADWLQSAKDLDDIPRFVRCSRSAEPGGTYPGFSTSQGFRKCDPLRWSEETLGQVCLAGIGLLTGKGFSNAAEMQDWFDAHPVVLDTVEYWQHTLTSQPADLQDLQRLYARGPALFLQVTGVNTEMLGPEGEPLFVTAARSVGPDTLLQLLRRETTWPGLEGDLLDLFIATILGRAEKIFEERHADALRQLWEDPGFAPHDYLKTLTALALSRVAPKDGRAVLRRTLRRVQTEQGVILTELARRYAVEERATLLAWFYGPEAQKAKIEPGAAAAILNGLAEGGEKCRPVLKQLVALRRPKGDDAVVVAALVAATKAAGLQVSARCSGRLYPKLSKSNTREQRDRAEQEFVPIRKACVEEAVRQLRTGKR